MGLSLEHRIYRLRGRRRFRCVIVVKRVSHPLPQKLDECSVDGERAQANPGGFYGGWITSMVVGPFKGAPGTLDW